MVLQVGGVRPKYRNPFLEYPSLSSPTAGFLTANPHALATILEASETQSIIASRDIFDVSGTKLWARDQPVSQALQRKLLDRQLRQPLESCLMAEDGVTARTLAQALEPLLARDTPLAPLLSPHASALAQAAADLPLHPVVRLLLSAGRASRPERFAHAVEAMALNGALTLAQVGDTRGLRIAMLCGLLHDIGEMYIDPSHGEADADRTLDIASYQHLVVHPHIGRLLLEQLTDYPAEVALRNRRAPRAPRRIGLPALPGRRAHLARRRQLAVTEAVLAALRVPGARLLRASVALRTVPGEFDPQWIGAIAQAARRQPMLAAQRAPAALQDRIAKLDAALQSARTQAARVMDDTTSPALEQAMALGMFLLFRLRMGWNASGLWSGQPLSAQDCAEVEAIEDELSFRLRSIERAVQLRAGHLSAADEQRLQSFVGSLGG
jgi:hypothetical protein